jgi:threonine synthase
VSSEVMEKVVGLQCVRCGETYPAGDLFAGCPRCVPDARVNLVPVYDEERLSDELNPETLSRQPATMWRYEPVLPPGKQNVVSLGEGMTPLIACDRLGERIGIPNLYVKDESQNPTASWKDRLVSVAVSMARKRNAPGLICSSTGNVGLACAAYSAHAGLPCIVLTPTNSPPAMRFLMRMYGAMVVATPEKQDRWTVMQACVEQFDWYPVSNYLQPFVGSNPYGVDGNKTLGLEICEQLGWQAPDVIAAPTAYGEGLWGAWLGSVVAYRLGLTESLPRMVAAEVFGPLGNALKHDLPYVEEITSGETVAYSVGTGIASYQALHALRQSRGTARNGSDQAILDMQHLLAETEGILGEAASMLPLVVLRQLREEDWLEEYDIVVAIITSSGVKDPALTNSFGDDVPVIQPDLDGLSKALHTTYGFSM